MNEYFPIHNNIMVRPSPKRSVFRLGVMTVSNYLIIRLRSGYVDFYVQIIYTRVNSV